MINKSITKIAALTVGITFALGFAASPAGAATNAEIQAMINQLLAQLAAQGGSSAPAASFTQNLTLGSTGSEVVSLQQALVAGGHLVMPAGVAMGYFGALTQAGVAKWQAANGVSPAAGYWGPLSRAKYASLAGPGMPGSPVPGAGISTPGVEGVLTATIAATPGSGQTLRENDEKKAVLGVELEAELSDIRIERLKVKLDSTQNNDRDLYRDIADKIYVMDGSTVVGSASLDSSTVVEETSGNYYVTIAGLNLVIKKDEEKTITLALDAMANFDSDFTADDWTLTIPSEGIRGVDGAGINLYAPSSGSLARTFESQPDQSEDASLAISLSSSSPDAMEVVAADGNDEDELDALELLRFDARAEDDMVTITDLVVNFTRGGVTTTATSSTAYLYDGSSVVGSANVEGTSATAMSATFDDIEVDINEDSTKTLSVRVDIDDATTAASTFLASVTAANVTAENSDGDDLIETGSATGEAATVRSIGVEWSLVSKSVSKSLSPESSGVSTSSVEAQFVVRAKAVGGDIMFGDAASTTYPFVSNAVAALLVSFDVYAGGALVTPVIASTTSITVPSGVVTSGLTNSFTLQENNSADLAVSFLFQGRTTAGALVTPGSYAVGLERMNWVSSAGQQNSTFMNAETSWRTSTVSLP